MTLLRSSAPKPAGVSSRMWLPPLVRRVSLFFFFLSLMSFFLFLVGNFQKYLSATLLMLLDLVLKFSYLTLGFSLAGFFLALFFPSARASWSAVLLQFITFLLAAVLFVGTSFIFTLLLPLEVSL